MNSSLRKFLRGFKFLAAVDLGDRGGELDGGTPGGGTRWPPRPAPARTPEPTGSRLETCGTPLEEKESPPPYTHTHKFFGLIEPHIDAPHLADNNNTHTKMKNEK